MKFFKSLIVFVLASAALSCNKEQAENSGKDEFIITAGIGEVTKTVLGPESEGVSKVLWSAGEEVDVWIKGSVYTFTGQNESPAEKVKFGRVREGLPDNLGTWVLVSPQGASSSASTATLPAVQTAVAGSFDPAAAILAGYGVGENVTCKHLYSGIRFKINNPGVKSISLRGNAGEKIAGEFTFDVSGGTPVISKGTSETIVLNAPGGGIFSTGTWYYILCLPTTFSNGFTITADNGENVGAFSYSTSFDCKRAVLKSKAELTMTNWAAPSTHVYYGDENSYCLKPNSSITIDVTPRKIYGTWQRSGIPATAAPVPDNDDATILWGASSIADAEVSDGKLTIMASSTEGSSLVAIKKGGTILWSFLIWVKDTIAETNLSNGKTFQETLGGQLYFQWGRKDPIKKDYSFVNNREDGTDYTNLDFSIQHPDTYVFAGTYYYDWYTNNFGYQDTELWGGTEGSKTVWDPCPAGWRVPKETDFSGLKADDSSSFGQYGYISESGNSEKADWVDDENTAWCWIREKVDDSSQSKSFVITTESTSIQYNYRFLAIPVRCVKE